MIMTSLHRAVKIDIVLHQHYIYHSSSNMFSQSRIFIVFFIPFVISVELGTSGTPLEIQFSTTGIPNSKSLTPFITNTRQTLEKWYPMISSYLSSPNYTTPSLLIVEFNNCTGSASSHDFGPYGQIWACTDHFEKNPSDMDAIIITATFIIQNYNTEPKPPLYVTYGVAKYVLRYIYKGNQKKSIVPPTLKEFGGDATPSEDLAYFFNFLNEKYNNAGGTMDLVQEMNMLSRQGKFKADEFWQKKFGKSVETLWKEMIGKTSESGEDNGKTGNDTTAKST